MLTILFPSPFEKALQMRNQKKEKSNEHLIVNKFSKPFLKYFFLDFLFDFYLLQYSNYFYKMRI